jgi:recombination associated protein RdgC
VFKNLILYRIAREWQVELTALEEALAKTPFTACGATQEQSGGWTPPRGQEHGLLAESVGGQWIARYMTEARLLPGAVLARKVREQAERIERETGRKPGKKEKRDLREQARQELLPMAFTRQSGTWVWIDPRAHLLALDAGAQGRADEIVTALAKALPGLSLALLDTQTSPQTAMARWLSEQQPPAGFSIDRECELKAADESKSAVRYARHPLDIEEVQAHIQAGKLPTRLAMTWDERVSFVLTEGLQLKKVTFLETVFDGQTREDSGFDADVAIATGELERLIPELIEALDGEGRAPLAPPAPAQAAVHDDGDAPF